MIRTDVTYFDGVDDYVSIESAEGLDITDAMTIDLQPYRHDIKVAAQAVSESSRDIDQESYIGE